MPPPVDRTPTPAEVPNEVMDGLVQVSFTVIALLSQAAAKHDLSLTQMRVLAILRDREPKMAELATFLGLDRSSVSGLIDRAVARGLVQRTSSRDDGRAVRVSLSPDGRRLAEIVTAEVGDLMAPMLDRLTAIEGTLLRSLLHQLLEGAV
jgi:DNA-binding MarR family transcriptional regulator